MKDFKSKVADILPPYTSESGVRLSGGLVETSAIHPQPITHSHCAVKEQGSRIENP